MALRLMVSAVWDHAAGKISDEEMRQRVNDARVLAGREPLP